MNRPARTHALALAACLALAGCGGDGAGQDATRTGGDDVAAEPLAPTPDFDAGAAFDLLRTQVAFGPRVPGTDAHRQQLEWMTAYLRERADTVVTQPFVYTTNAGQKLPMTNVFARFRPDAAQRVLLIAHWDTRSVADQEQDPALRDTPIPGANDGASGTALLMQLADMFEKTPPPLGVDLLFVDGEDYTTGEMYLGARHFAENMPDGYEVLYAVLVDMIADQDPAFPIEANSARLAPEVVDRVWNMAQRLGYGSVFTRSPGPTIEDDHLPLNQAGIRTIDVIDFDYGPNNSFWHTHLDGMPAVSARGLDAVGTVLATLMYQGG